MAIATKGNLQVAAMLAALKTGAAFLGINWRAAYPRHFDAEDAGELPHRRRFRTPASGTSSSLGDRTIQIDESFQDGAACSAWQSRRSRTACLRRFIRIVDVKGMHTLTQRWLAL